MTVKARKADVFDVWGKPPQALASGLSGRQLAALRRYVDAVAGKAYRLAYDLGTERGIDQAYRAASRLREQMLKGREDQS